MIFLKRVNILREKFPTTRAYPFNLSILQNTPDVQFDRAITLFIGENGTGKSTLLKALAHRAGIHIWQPEFNLRYEENPHEQELYKALSLAWEEGPVPGSYFGSQIFSHFARNLEEWAIGDGDMLGYFGGKSLITQSHGQSLMAYFTSRYVRKGIYFLDEPETALSPKSLVELLNLLIRIRGQGHAQFIIATHSPFLMACPGVRIYTFDGPDIRPAEYRETAYYQLYRQFMKNPEAFIESDPA